jgi:hypothetical protein
MVRSPKISLQPRPDGLIARILLGVLKPAIWETDVHLSQLPQSLPEMRLINTKRSLNCRLVRRGLFSNCGKDVQPVIPAGKANDSRIPFLKIVLHPDRLRLTRSLVYPSRRYIQSPLCAFV